MAGILKHWRESATLIIASRRLAMKQPAQTIISKMLKRAPKRVENSNEELYRILLLKRHSESSFMPNVFVFPGGVTDDTDFSNSWLEILGNDEKLLEMLQSKESGAPIFTQTNEQEFQGFSKEVALRITAIRETFEECGILLARPKTDLSNNSHFTKNSPTFGTVCNMPETLMNEWRTRVMSDPSQFAVMCRELEMIPDVWSLYEWSNWLTPVLRRQRYDTAFFVSCIDETPMISESEEIDHGVWANPSIVLHACSEGTLTLAPPQIYEMSRLIRFENADQLLDFAWRRSTQRVQRWMPVIYSCVDGMLFVLPGDDLYPEDPDWTGENTPGPIMLKETFAEIQKLYPNHNRALMQKGGPTSLYCNIEFVDGHILPIEHHDQSEFHPKM